MGRHTENIQARGHEIRIPHRLFTRRSEYKKLGECSKKKRVQGHAATKYRCYVGISKVDTHAVPSHGNSMALGIGVQELAKAVNRITAVGAWSCTCMPSTKSYLLCKYSSTTTKSIAYNQWPQNDEGKVVPVNAQTVTKQSYLESIGLAASTGLLELASLGAHVRLDGVVGVQVVDADSA